MATAKKQLVRETHVIDATDQVLGRLATRVARLLDGKGKPSYVPNLDTGDRVQIENAKLIKITGDKLNQKIYYRHSQHPGGLKRETLREVMEKRPSEALRRAIFNMLPKNRLRDQMMKRLKISN